MVGDAGNRNGDWSSVDIDVAKALNVKYYTPEEIFPVESDELSVDIEESDILEVIILVGYQGSGKSTICKDNFPNYKVISGDVLKTPNNMIKEAKKYIETQSIIFDATNGTLERRKLYIDLAKKYNRQIRCIWLDISIDNAIKRLSIRESKGGTHVPKIALYTFRKKFIEPNENEGFELWHFEID